METKFCSNMSELRRQRGLSQRKAAADLKISQALLSHYENGAREPGLGFVCRACRYYGVSADYLLGLSEDTSRNEVSRSWRALLRSFVSSPQGQARNWRN